jgi:hypothetical protein
MKIRVSVKNSNPWKVQRLKTVRPTSHISAFNARGLASMMSVKVLLKVSRFTTCYVFQGHSVSSLSKCLTRTGDILSLKQKNKIFLNLIFKKEINLLRLSFISLTCKVAARSYK